MNLKFRREAQKPIWLRFQEFLQFLIRFTCLHRIRQRYRLSGLPVIKISVRIASHFDGIDHLLQ